MNVIVGNEQQDLLTNLDIDIIKSISGTYDVNELVSMFKDFFFSKMILDVTAINQYKDIHTYEVLAQGLDVQKIIFLLPDKSSLCTPNFLSHLISLGIYNFTSKVNGIKYLLKKSNTLEDVAHIRTMVNKDYSHDPSDSSNNSDGDNGAISNSNDNYQPVAKDPNIPTKIIGFRNVTEHAGATTLIYMMKKELSLRYGHENVIAIEIENNDFQLFNEKTMISIRESEVPSTISKYSKASIILVDLNKCQDDNFCHDIVYLIEPSTIRLNGLIRAHKDAFSKLLNCKVVLNQSLLLNNDIFDFESEAGIKVFYNIPPLDERKRNGIIHEFIIKLGLSSDKPSNSGGSSKIFGLFRR